MLRSKLPSLWRPAVLCLFTLSTRSPVSRAELEDKNCHVKYEADEQLLNWSSTHSARVSKLYEPVDDVEVLRLLQHHSKEKRKLRPVGTALSPNGMGMPDDGTDGVSLRHLSAIRVNAAQGTVTVGAGATVSDLLKELSKHGLTLENFSSIQEQQLGGWTQVAAHGTGITLSTVEEQIVEMKIITPAHGVLTLSQSKNSSIFKMAKVGLGSLGVVSEVTLKCIPKMQLEEVTKVYDRESIVTGGQEDKSHYDRLLANRHVRYMWLPYTDTVVSVTSKIHDSNNLSDATTFTAETNVANVTPPTAQMVALLKENLNAGGDRNNSSKDEDYLSLSSYSVAGLRDLLLEYKPLSVSHISAINNAEAEFWKASQLTRIDDSVNVLGFDCGGEQWVLETCIPLGHLHSGNHKDVNFVKDLLATIEKERLPAPSPIEQRWTARSTAMMSPAYSADPDDKFCWVGVIMYVPANLDAAGREEVRQAFVKYCQAIDPILEKYNAAVHWAKIELPDRRDVSSEEELNTRLASMKSRLAKRYPVQEFTDLKKVLDPEAILSNRIIDSLFD